MSDKIKEAMEKLKSMHLGDWDGWYNRGVKDCIKAYEDNKPTSKDVIFSFSNQSRETYKDDVVATFDCLGLLRKEKVKRYDFKRSEVYIDFKSKSFVTETFARKKTIDEMIDRFGNNFSDIWSKVEGSEAEDDL